MNRLSRAAVLVTVALGTLIPLAPASASTDQTGGLTVIPGSGSDLSAIRVRTSAGCPAKANAYQAKVKGRDFPPDGQVVTSNTKASLSHSFGFDAYFLLIMRDYAKRNHTTLGGRYDITVFCIDSFTQQDFGEFTGSLEFTSPTHYEALGAAKPTGPPPPPLQQASDGSAVAPDTASSPAATPQVTSPPNNAAQGPTAAAPTAQLQAGSDGPPPSMVKQFTSERKDATGQGIPWLVLVGVVLTAGVVIAVASRIRKGAPGDHSIEGRAGDPPSVAHRSIAGAIGIAVATRSDKSTACIAAGDHHVEAAAPTTAGDPDNVRRADIKIAGASLADHRSEANDCPIPSLKQK